MRKIIADAGASFIHFAQSAVQEYASSLFRAFEDQAFFRALLGVIPDELRYRDAKKFRQLLDIPFGEANGGDATAVGTPCAIDLLFHVLRDAPEPALHQAMPLQMFAESLVLLAILLPEPANLNQIRQHVSRVAGIEG